MTVSFSVCGRVAPPIRRADRTPGRWAAFSAVRAPPAAFFRRDQASRSVDKVPPLVVPGPRFAREAEQALGLQAEATEPGVVRPMLVLPLHGLLVPPARPALFVQPPVSHGQVEPGPAFFQLFPFSQVRDRLPGVARPVARRP